MDASITHSAKLRTLRAACVPWPSPGRTPRRDTSNVCACGMAVFGRFTTSLTTSAKNVSSTLDQSMYSVPDWSTTKQVVGIRAALDVHVLAELAGHAR